MKPGRPRIWPSHRDASAAYYERRRAAAIAFLGGVCSKCGFADKRALQIDHVRGGGNKERSSTHRYRIYAEVLVDRTGKFQLLCANCNWIKRIENREI